ncbi:Protein muscleblind [Orchesella cincta]|uniref:Protein muscleblind n=1 Tax=Orchesella cincta TaxID=48709 RepID=A0A1D2N078_ORCCI|nr:Protein muscleblind [Orchesella cincta]
MDGRCNREKPPCKYFHPPLHLKDQLLINGRNHLALKNALMQQMGLTPGQPVVPGQVPTVATNPYLAGVAGQTYNPYFAAAGPLVPLVASDPTGAVMSPLGVPQQTVVQQKVPRGNETYPGVVTYKRPAGDKSGVPVYQPANNPSAAYQQLMQLQQPFVPNEKAASIANSVTTSSSGSGSGVGSGSGSSDHNNSGGGGGNAGLSNGTLESHDSGLNSHSMQKGGPSDGSDESNAVDGNNLGGTSSNDVDEDGKVESAAKRMRGANNNQTAVSSAAAVAAQNNAAYVAAAQSYHNALAAINYTGVALQTNKNATQPSVPVSSAHGFTGASTLQGHQQAAHQQQQQLNQQQQLLNQYQAMAAAALANPAAFQNPALAMQQMAAAGNQQNQNNMNNMNMNAAAASMNPFAAAAAMNPLLAASFPQIAAAQRASLMASQQSNAAGNALQGAAQLNSNALAGMQAAGSPAANAAAAAFNPFGVQFGGPGGAAQAASLPYQQAQNQQALLAAYASGQLARGPVPAGGNAQSMASQQLLMGNQAAAAAAAAAAAGNGAIPGQKRMRPA